MHPKIEKLRAERNKNRDKIAALQARNKELDSRISKLENTEIIGLVRDSGISLDDLEKFLACQAPQDMADTMTRNTDEVKEELTHETEC